MGALSPWHLAIVALVVIILFGSQKLPDTARGLGRALRIFHSEVREPHVPASTSHQDEPTTSNETLR